MRLRKTVIVPMLALALAAMLAACGGASGSNNPSGSSGGSASSATCASDLEFDFVQTDRIAGHVRDLFGVINVNPSPCTIKGYPIVTVGDATVKITNTTSADTWSNIAIQPITLPSSDDTNMTPNDLYYFAVQGRDDTTNCKLLSPSISFVQGTPGAPTSVINICGGELFVSPVMTRSAAYNL